MRLYWFYQPKADTERFFAADWLERGMMKHHLGTVQAHLQSEAMQRTWRKLEDSGLRVAMNRSKSEVPIL